MRLPTESPANRGVFSSLYAAGKDARFERAAVKWFGRFIEECSPSLLRAQFAPAALPELREEARLLRRCCESFPESLSAEGVKSVSRWILSGTPA